MLSHKWKELEVELKIQQLPKLLPLVKGVTVIRQGHSLGNRWNINVLRAHYSTILVNHFLQKQENAQTQPPSVLTDVSTMYTII